VEHLKELALDTERALRPGVVQISEEVGAAGKALLVRDARQPFAARGLTLLACTSDEQWCQYEDHRIPVEASFGLDEAAARDLMRLTRERTALLGMRLWLAAGQTHDDLVGGIAAFRHPEPTGPAARLQEVDVFPAYRSQGYGAALLESARRLLVREGIRTLVIGADEEDWPLGWYRRLGFREVVRVSKPIA
jgi:GNAT superfamily N-acetyltransferase